MFTNQGLALFAIWEQSPSLKKKFNKMAVGTLSEEQDTAYSGNEQDLRGTYKEKFGGLVVSVAENDNSIARVRGVFTPAVDSTMRGQYVREVGLYVRNDEDTDDILVWIDKFPATYIPNPSNEPGIEGSLVITVPIKFSSSDQIQMFTSNEALAKQSDLDEAVAEIKAGFMPVYLGEAVQSDDFTDSDVIFCAKFAGDGNNEIADGAAAYANMNEKPDWTAGTLHYIVKGDGNKVFNDGGRLNFSCYSNNLGTMPQWLNFDYLRGGSIVSENHNTSTLPSVSLNQFFVVCQKNSNTYFLVTNKNLIVPVGGGYMPLPGAGFFIPFK